VDGEVRPGVADARRLVVKIGSRALARDRERIRKLSQQVALAMGGGRKVVLVSSGAIALGMERLKLATRPRAIARLQAAAAVGQSDLMRAWEDAFAEQGLAVGQVLLTHSDLADRDRYLNARAALEALLELGAVPVINENDAVAVDEIRFGDNDQLAAMVATLVGADLLVLLTDVNGLLDANQARVSLVEDIDAAMELVRPGGSELGSGGMASKLDAARRATRRGVPVVIAEAARDDVLAAVMSGADVGTLCLPKGAGMASRKHWIAYTLKPQGVLVVDDGARAAVATGKRSLLAAGIVGVRGDFDAGDPVSIMSVDGREIARGLVRYGTGDAARLAGARTQDIEARLGRPGAAEVVHRDDLVVL
jgi:glutamate 5-kinase